jgi:hypothetical protein
MRRDFSLALATAFEILSLGSAGAQVAESGYVLPADRRSRGGHPLSARALEASHATRRARRCNRSTP